MSTDKQPLTAERYLAINERYSMAAHADLCEYMEDYSAIKCSEKDSEITELRKVIEIQKNKLLFYASTELPARDAEIEGLRQQLNALRSQPDAAEFGAWILDELNKGNIWRPDGSKKFGFFKFNECIGEMLYSSELYEEFLKSRKQ